ncbi:MAG: hypothetical protein ACRDQU_03580 [Pseudonocardiaceae bacterium]
MATAAGANGAAVAAGATCAGTPRRILPKRHLSNHPRHRHAVPGMREEIGLPGHPSRDPVRRGHALIEPRRQRRRRVNADVA